MTLKVNVSSLFIFLEPLMCLKLCLAQSSKPSPTACYARKSRVTMGLIMGACVRWITFPTSLVVAFISPALSKSCHGDLPVSQLFPGSPRGTVMAQKEAAPLLWFLPRCSDQAEGTPSPA